MGIPVASVPPACKFKTDTATMCVNIDKGGVQNEAAHYRYYSRGR